MNKKEKIKIKTYDGMYYTVDIVSDENSCQKRLAELNEQLKEEFIYLPIENKIINTREIKETIISY